MRIGRLFIGLLLALSLVGARAQEFVPVPPLQARITDQIGLLTPSQRASLENVLKEYEARAGSQIAMLLMSSTAPESIEQYSIRVADEWKLGRKGVDDGVLLIVARDNPPALRRLRIEAFRGVQGTLTDAQSKRIIEDVIAPHFRQNDFYGGLSAAASSIISLLELEGLPAPADGAAATGQDEDDFSFGLFVFLAILFFLMSRRGGRGRRRHQHGWGRSVPGVILGGAIGGGMGSRSGGFGGGGFGGGGFGGGGFGGGGFSGGGGGADGGGASGNW